MLQITRELSWIPDFPGQSELGTTLAGEHAVSFNRRRASIQLQEVMASLQSFIDEVEKKDGPRVIFRNAMHANRILADVFSQLESSESDLPVGNPLPTKKVTPLITKRSKEKRDEIIAFVLSRVESAGFATPVTAKEIMENTSLQSRARVSEIMSELIREGAFVSKQGVRQGGYLPTQEFVHEVQAKLRHSSRQP